MLPRLKELLFTNRGARQTVAKNAFWLSVSNIGGRFIRAIIIVYAARVLGAAGYGVFSYALGLAGFFTIFADIGINSILTRNVARDPSQDKETFATAFWLKAALLLGTGLVVMFAAPHFSHIPEAITLIPLVALLTIADGIREFCNSYFRAKEKMEREAVITTAMNVAIVGLGFAALALSATSYSFAIAYVGSSALGAVTGVVILRKEFAGVFSSFRRTLIRPIMNSAIPIAFLTVLSSLSLNVDMIMLGWWRTPDELGFYAAAQKIVQVLITFPGIIAASAFPALARFIGAHEKEREVNLVEKSVTLLFFLALPLTVGGIVLSNSIIGFLYGSEYLPASLSFQLLIAMILFVFPGLIFGNLLLAHDQQKKFAPVALFASLGNVFFNVLLIPPLGIAGAAIATLITQGFANLSVWRIVKHITPFKVFFHIKKIAVATVVMGIATFLMDAIKVNVLLNIAVSGGIYLLSLYALKEHLVVEIKSFLGLAKKGDENMGAVAPL
ncbi:MAG: flippase [Candidatus Jorgensenbacteria bacterium]